MAAQGIIGDILGKTPLGGLGITPQISQKDILIELTTDQLRQLLLKDADERAKNSVTIELHEGKLQLKIKLF